MSGEASQPATFDDGRRAAPATHGNSADWNWVLQAPAVWRSGAHSKGKTRLSLSFRFLDYIPVFQNCMSLRESLPSNGYMT